MQARKDATQIVANLQRQQVHSRLIASDYLERNKDLMDILIAGYVIRLRESELNLLLMYNLILFPVMFQLFIQHILFLYNMEKCFWVC